MKRLLALTLALLAATAGVAGAVGIGGGVYAGWSWPVVQEDVAQGTLYGLRVPVSLTSLFRVEPYFMKGALGDMEQDIGGIIYTREGFDETGYGLNLALTTGGPVSFYPFAGIGSTNFSREGDDFDLTTYNVGLGLAFSPMTKLSLDVRGEFQISVDGAASRKFGNLTVGASYALFSLP
jgi:opacity protein-like surface antigen